MTLAQKLETHLRAGESRRFGELILHRSDAGVFSTCHKLDSENLDSLPSLESIPVIRDLARLDAEGNYRPLKTAPTLRRGWKIVNISAEGFLKQLDAIYPAAWATWIQYTEGKLAPVPLQETLNRQTGMYRLSGPITDQMANQIMRDTCAAGCIRKIAWPIDDRYAVSHIMSPPRILPVICSEACTVAITAVCTLTKGDPENKNAPK